MISIKQDVRNNNYDINAVQNIIDGYEKEFSLTCIVDCVDPNYGTQKI